MKSCSRKSFRINVSFIVMVILVMTTILILDISTGMLKRIQLIQKSILKTTCSTATASATTTTDDSDSSTNNSSYCWKKVKETCPDYIKRNNHIVYNFENIDAGLLDRMKAYKKFADLSGYLCATLHVPKPSLQLAAKHNNNTSLDKAMSWSDLFELTYYDSYDNSSTTTTTTTTTEEEEGKNNNDIVLHELESYDIIEEGNKNGQWLIQRNTKKKLIPKKGPYITTRHPWDSWDHFFQIESYVQQQRQLQEEVQQQQQQQQHQEDQKKKEKAIMMSESREGFLWVITSPIYHMNLFKEQPPKDLVLKYSRHHNNHDATTSEASMMTNISSSSLLLNRPPSFPDNIPRGMPGCEYAQYSIPTYVQKVVDSVWEEITKNQKQRSKNIVTTETKSVVGHFHLRRGDAKRECDTSIAKLRSYLQCSFANIIVRPLAATNNSSNISSIATTDYTLLLSTDENDRSYLDELHSLVDNLNNVNVNVNVNVKMLELDDMIWKHTRKLFKKENLDNNSDDEKNNDDVGLSSSAPFLNNNFFVFVVGQTIKNRADFRLVQRKGTHCPDCEDIQEQLSSTLSSSSSSLAAESNIYSWRVG